MIGYLKRQPGQSLPPLSDLRSEKSGNLSSAPGIIAPTRAGRKLVRAQNF
jgi:hypothetical protein